MIQENYQFSESLVLWRSSYLSGIQKEKLFVKDIYPELQKIVTNALKASKIYVDDDDRKDALQEGFINAYLFLNRINILKYNDPRPAIFLAVRGGLVDYLKSVINHRIMVGEVFSIAVSKGWNASSETYSANDVELLYPVFQDPKDEKKLVDMFDSIFSVKLYGAIKDQWKDQAQVHQSDKDWRKFFGVEDRNYRSSFYSSVFKKAVKEYNSLTDEHLTIKKHHGKNGKAEAYTLYIRNKPADTPRLNQMYSERIYDYFKVNKETEIRITPDQFRKQFAIEGDSYQDNATLNSRIVQRSINEINEKTELQVYCEIERGGIRTTSIQAFVFYADEATLKPQRNEL